MDLGAAHRPVQEHVVEVLICDGTLPARGNDTERITAIYGVSLVEVGSFVLL
jgi:hypothetical protein